MTWERSPWWRRGWRGRRSSCPGSSPPWTSGTMETVTEPPGATSPSHAGTTPSQRRASCSAWPCWASRPMCCWWSSSSSGAESAGWCSVLLCLLSDWKRSDLVGRVGWLPSSELFFRPVKKFATHWVIYTGQNLPVFAKQTNLAPGLHTGMQFPCRR